MFVVEGSRARRTDARFGLTGREFLEVLDGLQEGDEVIVSDTQDYLHLRERRDSIATAAAGSDQSGMPTVRHAGMNQFGRGTS